MSRNETRRMEPLSQRDRKVDRWPLIAALSLASLGASVIFANALNAEDTPNDELRPTPAFLGKSGICVGTLQTDENGNWDMDGDGNLDFHVPDPRLCVDVETLATAEADA